MKNKDVITKLMFEQLEEKNFDLIQENQDLRSEVWSLRRMSSDLLSALNESEGMTKKIENKVLPRI